MAKLLLLDENKTITDFGQIQNFLGERNIEVAKWEATKELADDASQEDILAAYDHEVGPYMKKNGFKSADVISVHPGTENLEAIRNKFLSEHTHSEDEVRFFVDGEGAFYFHLDQEQGRPEEVFCVQCEQGDFLSVPAGYKHWFDLAPAYRVKAIRIFTNPEGWVASYTESGVDKKYIKN